LALLLDVAAGASLAAAVDVGLVVVLLSVSAAQGQAGVKHRIAQIGFAILIDDARLAIRAWAAVGAATIHRGFVAVLRHVAAAPQALANVIFAGFLGRAILIVQARVTIAVSVAHASSGR
jgi:hypothetical protein